MQAAGALLHDGQTVVLALVEARGDAAAVVLNQQLDFLAELSGAPGVPPDARRQRKALAEVRDALGKDRGGG